jgi:DNA-binding beta-propeller fold protein YncE
MVRRRAPARAFAPTRERDMTTTSAIASGLDGAVGCDYQLSQNRLVFVEFDGEINTLNLATGAVSAIGDGFTNLEDVKIATDGIHAYVTERNGHLRRINLGTFSNPGNSTVISSGMTAPHQIYIDHARDQLFVVEYAASGRIFRIDLAHTLPVPHTHPPTHPRTIVASGLQNAVGLVVTADLQFAFVSEQRNGMDGQILRVDLETGKRAAVATGLKQPFFLTWADEGESALYFTERDAGLRRLSRLDLATGAITYLVSGLPDKPSSAATTLPNHLVVCSDQVVTDVNMDPFAAVAGPGVYLVGIGKIPWNLVNTAGLATTGPNDPFPGLVDAPFGGRLGIKVDHPQMAAAGAAYYKVKVDGQEVHDTFYDYLRNSAGDFILTPTPSTNGFFPVRNAVDVWYDPRMGASVDPDAGTTPANGALRTITIELYSTAHALIPLASTARASLAISVDNREPTAAIAEVNYFVGGGVEVVGACAVVPAFGTTAAAPAPGLDDRFTFMCTASHPHAIWSWSLIAMWGDNKSSAIASGNNMLMHTEVPAHAAPWLATVTGDPTSRQCAHTFYLGVWDRVTNGEFHIHYQWYTKSITLNLPPL